jgi:hypothetical protein
MVGALDLSGWSFMGRQKWGKAQLEVKLWKTALEGHKKCGQIIGFPSSTLPLEAL